MVQLEEDPVGTLAAKWKQKQVEDEERPLPWLGAKKFELCEQTNPKR